jgi:uncharacterized protein YgbK (DUF1537 family)
LFARLGIGSNGAIHRLDRHPSISKHPVTPMTEADVRLHLAKQTNKTIALFDILQLALPEKDMRAALKRILEGKPDAVLFDALYPEQLGRIGGLMNAYASMERPLFSIGSSGVETALAMHWTTDARRGPIRFPTAKAASQILVGSGSCSAVTEKQIAWALKNGFAEVPLNTPAFVSGKNVVKEFDSATKAVVKFLRNGRSVIVHTTRKGADKRVAARLKHGTARILGTALGEVLQSALEQSKVRRVCIAGGDTSSFAARRLGIEALEMIAPLTPGAPLCKAFAPGSPADGLEFVFKGGQVGAENYFGIVKHGKTKA